MSEFNLLDNEDVLDRLELIENKILERGDLSKHVPCNYYDFSLNVVELEGKPRLAVDIFSDEDGFDASEVNWDMVAGTLIDRLEDAEFFGFALEALGRNVETDRVLCLSADDFVREAIFG